MDKACGTREEVRDKYKNQSENPNGRDHLGVLGMDGRIMGRKVTEFEDGDWINLTQDRYQLRALLNTVMKLRV
jgi:hypothetical protein